MLRKRNDIQILTHMWPKLLWLLSEHGYLASRDSSGGIPMRLRRALLVTTAVSTVLFGSAGMAYAQSFDWSGFYVGVGVAGGMGSSDGELTWFDPDNEIWTEVLGGSTTSDPEPFVGTDNQYIDFPGSHCISPSSDTLSCKRSDYIHKTICQVKVIRFAERDPRVRAEGARRVGGRDTPAHP